MESETPDKSREQFVKEVGKGVGDNIASFVEGLAREGDRSAVILGAARLDISLEGLLNR